MYLAVCAMQKRSFLNTEALSEMLQTEEDRQQILDSACFSVAFLSGITRALKAGLLVWLVKDAMLVSRVTEKNMSPHQSFNYTVCH